MELFQKYDDTMVTNNSIIASLKEYKHSISDKTTKTLGHIDMEITQLTMISSSLG